MSVGHELKSASALLGRAEVRWPADVEMRVAWTLAERDVVITGAGGTIGSAIARRLAALGREGPRLWCVDRDETRLAALRHDLRRTDARIQYALHDARYAPRGRWHDLERPVLIHAAAHKHVDVLEGEVLAAVDNNILATAAMLDAAVSCRASWFVLISTDKAVRPTNTLGLTKALAERLVRSVNAPGRRVIVRLVNVLGSSGSVLDVWARQAERGQPVDVCPGMRRWWITIDEAVDCVLAPLAVDVPEVSVRTYVPAVASEITTDDLFERFARLHSPAPAKRIVPARPGDRIAEEMTEGSAAPVPGVPILREDVP